MDSSFFESFPEYRLSPSEVGELDDLIGKLDAAGYDPADQPFYGYAWQLIPLLPSGLREFLSYFRKNEPAAACLIKGFSVDDDAVGPTPKNWDDSSAAAATRREELFVGLLAMCLGEIFGWSTLQAGRMIHNVIPVRGETHQQSGHGQVLLEWHTEDGFHPYRCDYLLLFGIRNHDRVPTTISSVRDVRLSPDHAELLAQPRFHIMPDDEHLRQLAIRRPGHPGLRRVQRMRTDPQPVPVLFAALTAPYLRIDPHYMRCADEEAETALALRAIVDELNRVQRKVCVEPGCLLVVDNFLAVHGRQAYSARFDGTDRWLKKAVVTRDLRKSRDMRESTASRVII